MEYPSACELYLDGHRAGLHSRRSHNPRLITIRYGNVSDSSSAPFLFSPLVVTGEKALLLPAYLELILDATR